MTSEATYLKADEMLLNMGPQHPSTHGVLRVVIRTDGEIIRSAAPHIGYLHRCKEKIAETVTYPQFIPYTDRMDVPFLISVVFIIYSWPEILRRISLALACKNLK